MKKITFRDRKNRYIVIKVGKSGWGTLAIFPPNGAAEFYVIQSPKNRVMYISPFSKGEYE